MESKTKNPFQNKADFSDIYQKEAPFEYLAQMNEVGYRLPDRTKDYFVQLLKYATTIHRHRPVNVLDIGCSYGVNAALLKYDLRMEDLFEFYGKLRKAGDEAREPAIQWLSKKRETLSAKFCGLDISEPALRFANDIGLHEEGICLDIETAPLSPELLSVLSRLDLILSTGCIGYVGTQGLEKILQTISTLEYERHRPLFGFSSLRYLDIQPIEKAFRQFNYSMKRMNAVPVVQRHFISTTERESAIQKLKNKKCDTSQFEDQGSLSANVFLAYPQDEADNIAKCFKLLQVTEDTPAIS